VRNVWGINRVLLRISIWFSCQLLDFTSQIERLHVPYYCADVWRVLAHFYSEYSRARPSTGRSGQIIDSVCISQFSWCALPISCSRSTVGVAAPAIGFGLSHAVHWCVTDYRQLSAVRYDPFSHPRHNAGDRSTKVGHEISRFSRNVVCERFLNVHMSKQRSKTIGSCSPSQMVQPAQWLIRHCLTDILTQKSVIC